MIIQLATNFFDAFDVFSYYLGYAHNRGFSCYSCLRMLQLLTEVEWGMGPPLLMGRFELGISDVF